MLSHNQFSLHSCSVSLKRCVWTRTEVHEKKCRFSWDPTHHSPRHLQHASDKLLTFNLRPPPSPSSPSLPSSDHAARSQAQKGAACFSVQSYCYHDDCSYRGDRRSECPRCCMVTESRLPFTHDASQLTAPPYFVAAPSGSVLVCEWMTDGRCHARLPPPDLRRLGSALWHSVGISVFVCFPCILQHGEAHGEISLASE